MKTKQILLIISIAVASFSASVASAAMRGGGGMATHSSVGRAMAPSSSRFTSTSRFNQFNHFHRFNHFHNRTFVFVDAFGFTFFDPFFYGYYPYPCPYYGYYPYGYDGYGYGYGGGPGYGYGSDRSSVVALQRQLARAGYYHGSIDGIIGPQTRRAMRAYRRDHNMPA